MDYPQKTEQKKNKTDRTLLTLQDKESGTMIGYHPGMKNSTLRLLAFCSIVLFWASCTPEDTDPTDDGTTDARDTYVGTWHCTENSQIYGNTAYDVNILKKGTDSLMVIENFYNLNFSNKVTVSLNSTGTKFLIPSQTVSGHTINGTGQSTGKTTLQWDYTVNDGGSDDIVTATYTKQ